MSENSEFRVTRLESVVPPDADCAASVPSLSDDSALLGVFSMAPHVLLAIELSGQADGSNSDTGEGVYLELGVEPGLEAKWSQFLTSKLKARGVPIGAGTDTPISLAIPGYALHTELELLVEGGLTPLEEVHAATVQPARFFGLDDEMGQVQAGMRADLLLLDGNPAEDIRNTRRIAGVMTRGEWVP